ncbi:MAG: hypothetical protein FWF56_04630 [Firmicutes bacterium]|nr:hypothetical protein [Bacillota bacterium]MCL1953676.1 hypothetical protein [Bacillota bacterium]
MAYRDKILSKIDIKKSKQDKKIGKIKNKINALFVKIGEVGEEHVVVRKEIEKEKKGNWVFVTDKQKVVEHQSLEKGEWFFVTDKQKVVDKPIDEISVDSGVMTPFKVDNASSTESAYYYGNNPISSTGYDDKETQNKDTEIPAEDLISELIGVTNQIDDIPSEKERSEMAAIAKKREARDKAKEELDILKNRIEEYDTKIYRLTQDMIRYPGEGRTTLDDEYKIMGEKLLRMKTSRKFIVFEISRLEKYIDDSKILDIVDSYTKKRKEMSLYPAIEDYDEFNISREHILKENKKLGKELDSLIDENNGWEILRNVDKQYKEAKKKIDDERKMFDGAEWEKKINDINNEEYDERKNDCDSWEQYIKDKNKEDIYKKDDFNDIKD